MSKKLYAALIATCIVLGGICGFLLMSEDDMAPVLHVPEDVVTYYEGDSQDRLLEGVTAEDNKDGDVTANVMVEKIIPDQDATTAVVVYVVKDKANNVTKVSRKVKYVAWDNEQDGEQEEDNKSEGEQTVTPTPTATPTPTPTATPTPTPTIDPFEGLAADAPRITLKQSEMTVKVGESVNRIALVEKIEDDEDSDNYLWAHIHIEGDRLNTNKAGTYKMVYYVIDSDGNRSNEAEMTITVK